MIGSVNNMRGRNAEHRTLRCAHDMMHTDRYGINAVNRMIDITNKYSSTRWDNGTMLNTKKCDNAQ